MITFDVVKEKHGWAIRMGKRMSSPFSSRDVAIYEANCLADAIRRHGELTEVIVEAADPKDLQRPSKVYRLPIPSRWPQIDAKSNLAHK